MEARIVKKQGLSRFNNVLHRIALFRDWYKLVFPWNRFFTGVQKLTLRNGISVYVRDIHSIDMTIVRDVLFDDEYAIRTLSLPEHAVVFDIGANIGTFSLAIHHRFPTAVITAYEPHPDNFRILQMNAPFATLVCKAATEHTGSIQLEDGNNFVVLHVVKEGGITVPSQSLDDILSDVERVDLLKVDIEGSEYGLFNAASPETFKKIQRIIMELHVAPNFDERKWAESFFTQYGFRISWLTSPAVIYAEKL